MLRSHDIHNKTWVDLGIEETRPLIMEASMNDGSFLWLVNDGDEHRFYGAVLLIRDRQKTELLSKASEAEGEAFFSKCIEEYKEAGKHPVITYCSYD